MNYSVGSKSGLMVVTIETVYGLMQIETAAPDNAKMTFTATTDMQRVMGKVLAVSEKACFVDTVWNNRRKNLQCRRLGDLSIGTAAWVSEHLTLDGDMEIVCSKTMPETGDINFINLSWDSSKLKIDVLTGDTKLWQ